MAQVQRIKRRLLKQAVNENVALLRGRRPDSVRVRRERPALRIGVLFFLPVAVYASVRVATLDGVAADQAIHGLAMTLVPAFEPAATDADRRINQPPPEVIDPAIFPLEVRKIVIDPGHGGDSPGTVTSTGVKEKDIVLDLGLMLRDELLARGFEVAMTRSQDVGLDLEERVRLANEAEGDLFVSIHVNWISARNVRGVETYYLGPTEDPYLNQLASQENQESGYSLADFRRLLQGVYEQVRKDESRALAESVQVAMHRSLRQVNPKLDDRGVKTAPFVVLIGTQMPAILAEVSCLSNDQEAELLQKPRYRQYIAEALAKGVEAYADTHGPRSANEKGSETG